MTIRDRIFEAGDDLQELAESIAALVLTEKYPDLTPIERSEVAEKLGRIRGIGIGIGWIAKYELSE